mgnify:CR=1 FL=1
MKNRIINTVIFVSLVILSALLIFVESLNDLDELWQYSFANNIANGLVPYKDFNIIVVSESIQLPKENNAFVFDGEICFDFNTNSLDFDTRINPYFVVFGGFFSILIMLMSIGTETVISLLFGFRGRQTLTILIVNICSQIIMRLLYLVLPFTYLIETIILEVCVYTAEFFIYKKYFKGTSVIKLVGYTLTANTLSLLLGIFLDCYILI